jgi:DNA excision repair protein ERCC-2
LELESYETWLASRLDELVLEVRHAEEQVRRRRALAVTLGFPFDRPRKGQPELMREIELGMAEKKPVLLQAPTGLGKTAGVIFPLLREALARGQRLIYATPKNSQHELAREAARKLREAVTAPPPDEPAESAPGAQAGPRDLTITAKARICMKNEPLCNPEYCEFANEHYTKVAEKDARGRIAGLYREKGSLGFSDFKALAEELEACPYELQLEAIEDADIVVCDYHYVLSPQSALGRAAEKTPTGGALGEGRPNLALDEAHNLPSRAMDHFSAALSSAAISGLREELDRIAPRYREEFSELIDSCAETVLASRPAGEGPALIPPPLGPVLERDSELRAFLSRYLDGEADPPAKDPVLRLCFLWSGFAEALRFADPVEYPEFFTAYHPTATGGILKITCCDPARLLQDRYSDYQQVVAFSATLKPFEYYAALSGIPLERARTAELPSPFEKSRRKLLIIPQVSTRYSARARNYPRIAEAISRISALKPGNYLAFFPSFDFLERVHERLEPPPGFALMRQSREMHRNDVDSLLTHLREALAPTLVLAVQGGIFSEGVDFAGDAAIGAFVVGPPLPTFDLERETMREYYAKRFGKTAGFDYAYTYPAMAKAIQAAGRVIRSETDRGIVVLMDGRFLEPAYSRTFPRDWFERSPRELVSTSILADVGAFWRIDGPA